MDLIHEGHNLDLGNKYANDLGVIPTIRMRAVLIALFFIKWRNYVRLIHGILFFDEPMKLTKVMWHLNHISLRIQGGAV